MSRGASTSQTGSQANPSAPLSMTSVEIGLEAGNGFQEPDFPVVGGGSHQADIVQGDAIAVDQVVAIEHLNFQIGSVVQLQGATIGRVEVSGQLVPVVNVAGAQAGF